MRVFLASATGVIGRVLTPLLLAQGHQVTEMTRRMNARDAATALAPTNRLRHEGTRNLIAAVRAAGVRRLVAT
jgi:nucleoside-diphosphate-sugar epimerase